MDRDEFTTLFTQVGQRTAKPHVAAEKLLPVVYAELQRRAQLYLRRERAGHTLDPTALVHEAYERLVDQSRVDWRGRTHFVAVASQVMRRLLIDHARRRGREKRGGGWDRVTMSNLGEQYRAGIGPEDVLAIDRALSKLGETDSRAAKVLELRIFGGLGPAEVGAHLGISERTARNDWAFARAWLREELSRETR
jgi:RNA polymerase sigma-70 factor (ECF subfamily)